MTSPAALFASILFGLLGLAAIRHARKQMQWQPLVGGIALIAFPYFIERAWLIYLIGFAICYALYLFRE